DQIEFMGNLLQMVTLQTRFSRALNTLQTEKKLSGSEAVVLLHLLRLGEVRRGEIQRISGVKARQANKIVSRLLNAQFVQSSTPKGPLRLKVGRDIVRFLFPEFYE